MAEAVVMDPAGRAEWNRLVSVAGSPYHRYEWMEAVASAYGHRAYPLAAVENGAVLAVLPLMLMQPPLAGKNLLVSLPFCDLGGLAGSPLQAGLLKQRALELAEELGARILEVRQRGREGLGFDFDRLAVELEGHKVSMILELEPDSEKQMAAFKPKLRSQIKKAMKNGCTTELGNNRRLIEDFYFVFSRNMHALGSPVHSRALFHEMAGAYGEDAVVGVVYSGGRAAAAGMVLKNGTNAAIPWASSLAEYNRLAPNMLLYWELLAHCADHGIHSFDFGRSSFGEGTFRFKKQWGAQPYPLTWENWLDPAPVAAGSPGNLRRLAEQAWRRLPLSLVNLLGPLIRKHIRL